MSLLSPRHLEFYAEDTMITIVPKFATKRPFKFLNHSKIDAFLPSIPVKVPLWMAMYLKRKLKCQIKTPQWMDPDRLASVLEEEKRENSFSSDIPEHYTEISSMLLEVASGDDISNEDAQRMRLLLEDIRNTRQAKIRQGIKQVMNSAKDGVPPNVIKITNVGSMEIEAMREVLLKGVEEVHKFKIQRGSTASSSSSRNTPAARQRYRKSTFGSSASQGGSVDTPTPTASSQQSSQSGGSSKRKRKIRRFR